MNKELSDDKRRAGKARLSANLRGSRSAMSILSFNSNCMRTWQDVATRTDFEIACIQETRIATDAGMASASAAAGKNGLQFMGTAANITEADAIPSVVDILVS